MIRPALAAAAMVSLACGERADGFAAEPAWSPESAALIYSAKRGDTVGIWFQHGVAAPRLFLDGSARRNFAKPSPDGSRLAYQLRTDGAFEIHVASVDGSGDRNLTADPSHDVLPAWSPDGGRIAFMSTRGFELGGDAGPFPGHIYVVGADGSGLRQVTREPLASSLGPQDWSPDGRTLLLSRTVGQGLDLFALDVESGAEVRLTSGPADEYGAAYSPDGTRIALHVEADGVSHIALMGADGTGLETLTSGPGLRYGPRWSPDGAWLLFAVEGLGGEPGQYDLRAVRIADRYEVLVVATPEDEREGSWPGTT